ncbi:MAG: tetratricopeptide repeat protein [Pseudomonadota bacterium]
MLEDRFGNQLETRSDAARDAYVEAVDLFLGANAGALDAFEKALQADPQFTRARAGLARVQAAASKIQDARRNLALAESQLDGASAELRGHVLCLGDVTRGDGVKARARIEKHLADHPRDVMALQPMTGVFGLIGFSGAAGREQYQRAFIEQFAQAYAEDWWFTGQYAFALAETGAIRDAENRIAVSLDGHPRNANAAHIKGHIHYEQGEAKAGFAYLKDWAEDYPRGAPLHCHVSWHLALWSLEQGDVAAAWARAEDAICPGAAAGPPINVATDTAAFLFRAELAGEAPRPDLWRKVSAYAADCFPTPGVAFADVHAALAHAMCGDSAALARIISDAKGPAADVVRTVGEGFGDFVAGRYTAAAAKLEAAMPHNERLGGSRAQRDLIAYAIVAAHLRAGNAEAGEAFIASHRPARAGDPALPTAQNHLVH